MTTALYDTPLWPAGHLPLKGGDWQFGRRHLPFDLGEWRKQPRHLISPLAGEVAGRPEGGGTERDVREEGYQAIKALSGC
ncbi:hypothetical protein MPLB_710005 [Mesorhizobium sp. ORS 3324]|nr:hypothetical protein MPLB_710005 [Mesorhizobium sp. ORS 3324]